MSWPAMQAIPRDFSLSVSEISSDYDDSPVSIEKNMPNLRINCSWLLIGYTFIELKLKNEMCFQVENFTEYTLEVKWSVFRNSTVKYLYELLKVNWITIKIDTGSINSFDVYIQTQECFLICLFICPNASQHIAHEL